MLQKLLLNLKEKLFSVILKTKNASLLGIFLFLVILGLFLPTYSAQAALPIIPIIIGLVLTGGIGAALAGQPWLLATVGNFITALLVLFLQLPLLIINGFFALSVTVLNWVTSPGFISLSYTRPEDNPLIEAGWTLTRDLANMAFIIIFVIIGLATALRVSEYQWQKTLPRLILIALLINFSPVILGIIVDAANILINFFLEEGVSFSLWRYSFSNWFSLMLATFKDVPDSAWHTATLAKTITLIFFGFIAGIVLFLYSLLFIMRYVAIWALVILSPFAFAAYILPTTQHYWRQWWNQFLQWSFIGVIAAFFLYLSSHLTLLARPGGNLLIPLDETGDIEGTAGLLNEFLPFGIVIAFLVIGLFSGFSGAAAGAGTAIGFAQKQAKATGKWAEKKGRDWLREKGRETRDWTREKATGSEKIQRLAKRMAQAKTPEGAVSRRLTDPFLERIRQAGRTLGPEPIEARGKEISSAEAQAEKIDTPELLASRVRDTLGRGRTDEAIGLVAGGIKKGRPFKKALEDILGSEPETIAGLGSTAKSLGAVPMAERIARGFVGKLNEDQLKKMVGGLEDEDKQKGYETVKQKLIGEARKDEIKDFAKNFWAGAETMEAIQRFWEGPQLSRAADEFGRTFVDDYMKITRKFSDEQGEERFAKINPKAMLYLSGNAAQDLGFESIGGLTRDNVRTMIRKEKPTREEVEREIPILRTKIREEFPEVIITPPPTPTDSPRRPGTIGDEIRRRRRRTP